MDEKAIPHTGAWGLAVIMVVIASWILYRHLAPKTWREWAGAGLVQAFIVALYAEMYGFPLTLYLVARLFGLDRTDLNASLWSMVPGVGETGMLIFMIFGYVLLFAGIGIFAEGWRELYRAHGEGRLATDGLYAVVRHPQYTGLFIGLFGEGVVHWPTPFSVGAFPLIVLMYVHLAKREEKIMAERFGGQYIDYRRGTPMFFPRLGQWGRLFERPGGDAGERHAGPDHR